MLKKDNDMDLDKYIKMENEKIPSQMKEILSKKGGITKTEFADKNHIITNQSLHTEAGYDLMEDGSYLVSMYIPMPNVTKEMVEWWFWWHASDSKRYKAWYPKEHIAISYHPKNKEYFKSKTVPEFQQNTQYPVERVGKLIAPLSIDFVSPESFGFDKDLMMKHGVDTIVCGHVGAFKSLIDNTEMAHIFVKSKEGLLLVSRFWLGKNVKSKFLKKLLLTEEQAKGMAEHCFIEYHNFASKIPLMYAEWINSL